MIQCVQFIELSEVLWTQVLTQGYLIAELYGGVLVYIVFGIWAFFTLAILVMMEGLSAFLHTLRLHWYAFGIRSLNFQMKIIFFF